MNSARPRTPEAKDEVGDDIPATWKKIGKRNDEEHAEVAEKTRKRVALAQKTFASAQPVLDAKEIDKLIRTIAVDIKRTLNHTAPLVLTLHPTGLHFSNHLTEELENSGMILEENYFDPARVLPFANLRGRTVIITDIALRDGKSLQAALDYCEENGAREVYFACLIDMPEGRATLHQGLLPNFFGARCADQELVGFGFDIDGFFRNEQGLSALPNPMPPSSNLKTSNILAALDSQAQKPKPLLLQENISVDQDALERASKAAATIKTLDCLYTQEQVDAKIEITAQEVAAAITNKNPVVLTMQKGGSHFSTYLTEHLPEGMAIEEGSMHLSRYGNAQHGRPEVEVLAPPSVDVRGRVVVIAEDLIEGGLTIEKAAKICFEKGATEVFVAAMGDKAEKREPGLESIKPSFSCFRFDKRFLVGRGLDEQGFGRGIRGIFAYPKPSLVQANNTELDPGAEVVSSLAL